MYSTAGRGAGEFFCPFSPEGEGVPLSPVASGKVFPFHSGRVSAEIFSDPMIPLGGDAGWKVHQQDPFSPNAMKGKNP